MYPFIRSYTDSSIYLRVDSCSNIRDCGVVDGGGGDGGGIKSRVCKKVSDPFLGMTA